MRQARLGRRRWGQLVAGGCMSAGARSAARASTVDTVNRPSRDRSSSCRRIQVHGRLTRQPGKLPSSTNVGPVRATGPCPMRRHPRGTCISKAPFSGVASRASVPRSGCNAAGLAGTRYHPARQPASRQTAARRHTGGRWTGTTGGSSHARSAGDIPERGLMEKKSMEKA